MVVFKTVKKPIYKTFNLKKKKIEVRRQFIYDFHLSTASGQPIVLVHTSNVAIYELEN